MSLNMPGIPKAAIVLRKLVFSRGSRDGMWFGGEGDSDCGGIILTLILMQLYSLGFIIVFY